jgi:Predicted nucleotide-binding protein containing TIR-like domain
MPDDPFSLPRNPYDTKLPFGPPSQFGVTGPGQTPPQRLTPMQMPAAVSVTQQVSTIKKLEDSISAIDKMLSQGELRPERCAAVLMNIQSALAPIFGGKSKIVLSVGDWKKDLKPPFNSELFCSRVAHIRQFVSILKTCSDEPSLAPISVASRPPLTKSVFIIHGHDENNWLKLDRILRTEFKLDPIVILARAGMSQPTIQKFESDASRCSYAIAMFTPDDTVTNEKAGLCAQARPNVVFEAGWFVGRLGKERVLLLVKDGTRLHSDFDGLNQIRFRDDISEKFLDIKRELEAADLIPS